MNVPHLIVMTLRFERYVAIGDSSTEGLEDPDGAGGYRGWAKRLAKRLAQAQGGLLEANLGVRGKRSWEIREEQLGPALAMRPDLATVFAGSNDILERGFDAGKLRAELECMMGPLVPLSPPHRFRRISGRLRPAILERRPFPRECGRPRPNRGGAGSGPRLAGDG